MPVTYNGTQYSGIWTMQQVNFAIAAGTWPSQPAPKLFSWGYGKDGQLGLGNSTDYSSPVQVGSLTNWLTLAASGYAAFGIKTDGTLWSWGNGNNGVLGLGNTTSYSSPKQVGSLTAWLQATGGRYFAFATKTNGTLWSWGNNANGQLGQSNTANLSSPVQIGAITTWGNLASQINSSGASALLY